MSKTGKYTLTFWIFGGFILGIITGAVVGEPVVPFVKPLASIFLRLLRMAIIPLVITSIVSAVAQVGTAYGLGRIGLRTLGYYIMTSFIAIITGQTLVNIFKPGAGAEIGLVANPESIEAVEQGLGDILLNIIPENPIQAMASGDVLPVIFFSILFGFFITRLKPDQRDLLKNVFDAAFEAMLKMTTFIIWSAPLGVFGIITEIVAETGFSAFKSLGFYFIIVLAGLAIHYPCC
jgi:proton glutamate symport protein